MAERRMFAKTIIDSDAFLDMPMSTQCLYFHLAMRADDDGFLNNPKKVQRMIGASDDDLKVLLSKRFLLPFDSGVVVIKHWKIHNYIQKDRYKPTVYQEEKAQLQVKENGAYTRCIQDVYSLETQDRLEIGKDRIGQDKSISSAHVREEDEDDGFETFWSAYPVKSGDIRQAYFEYVGALQGGATVEQIMEAVAWQSTEKETRYMPSAEKWLRNKGWTEARPKPQEKPAGKSRRMMSAADYANREIQPVDMDALRSVIDKI